MNQYVVLATTLSICAAASSGQQNSNDKPTRLSSTCVNCAPQESSEDLTGPLTTFDPDHQQPLSYSDHGFAVTLVIGAPRLPNTWRTLYLRINDRASGASRSVYLPEDMAQVNSFTRGATNNTFIVIGKSGRSAWEVAVVNLSSGSIEDKFFCAFPSVSPDGRYIAFLELHPAHFVDATEDHYMLYDLSRSAPENRPKNVRSEDQFIVGKCIYPVGVGYVSGDNMTASAAPGHVARSEFFWRPQSDEVLFTDQVNAGESITMVLADIKSDANVEIRTLDQPIADLCVTPDHKTPTCPILMRKAIFENDTNPRVIATFELVNVRLLRTREYDLSLFR